MQIRSLGHACFLLTTEAGVRLVLDPYDAAVGYPLPEVTADIVTISHEHHDHSNRDLVEGNPFIIDREGHEQMQGVSIDTYPCWHDDQQGQRRGENLWVSVQADGLRVCHAGDLGHLPDRALLAKIGAVDVLMLPVGGYYTIDAAQAWQTVQLVKPRVVIPMHYRTEVCVYDEIAPVADFLAQAGAPHVQPLAELSVNAKNIGHIPPIVVLEWRHR